MHYFPFSPIFAIAIGLIMIMVALFLPIEANDSDSFDQELTYKILEMKELLSLMGFESNPKPNYGYTPLMVSSKWGDVLLTKILLYLGANVNSRNNFGWSALMFAAQNGHKEIVQILIERGASIQGDCLYRSGLSKGKCLIVGSAASAAENGGYDDIAKLIREKISENNTKL